MLPVHWLLRARLWIAQRPSPVRVAAVGAAVGLVVLILAIEHFIGWPDWATAARLPRTPIIR